ncbi:YfaZ family outer membrane protein [Pantoea sp. USHLN256]|uniref:YfaZ family outer membrane protein n=1 Tax=Pantoea sp. USHLN256 TaxID=3081293 RepID=UPI00301A2AC7
MKKHYLAVGLMLASTGISAAEIGIKGGSDFFSATLNTEKTALGLQYGAEYMNGERKTQMVEGSIGYGFAFGALSVAPRVGAFWADLDNDKSGSRGMNAGVRFMAPLPKVDKIWLYLDYSVAPDFATRHMHHLYQFEAGLHYQPANWLTLSSGYRYLSTYGKYGQNDQNLINGVFIGAAYRF